MPKQSVKVVIRTRPTPNFCSKNLQIDPINSVSLSFNQWIDILCFLVRTWQFTSQKMPTVGTLTMLKSNGSLNLTRLCITLLKKTCSPTALKTSSSLLWQDTTEPSCATVRQERERHSPWMDLPQTSSTEEWFPELSRRYSKKLEPITIKRLLWRSVTWRFTTSRSSICSQLSQETRMAQAFPSKMTPRVRFM